MIVYDGTLTTEQAEKFWQDFTGMPDIEVRWNFKGENQNNE
jgi:hypothetical protein